MTTPPHPRACRNATSSQHRQCRCFPSPVRCYSGIQSLCIVVPPGLTGGAFVDAPAREGWLYVARARIFHEEAPPSSSAEQPEAGTRLVLWDMRDGKETSVPATKMGEWEVRFAFWLEQRHGYGPGYGYKVWSRLWVRGWVKVRGPRNGDGELGGAIAYIWIRIKARMGTETGKGMGERNG